MTDPVTIIRAIVRDELKSVRLGDLAVVTSAFPHAAGDANNYECNVRLREGNLELRKVPIATPHVGMVSAPQVGDLVIVAYVGGDPNRAIVIGRLYSDQARPPVHKEKEWRVESPLQGQTSLAIDDKGTVVIKAGETVVKVNKDGKVEIKCSDCKIDASGKIELGEGELEGKGVITEDSHRCYFTGARLVGSKTVTAKG